jgi:hypothetical protein
MAAHIQNTGGGEASGWIAGPYPVIVPEPSSLALLALGVMAAIGCRFRRRHD